AQDASARGRLTAARLADQAERLARQHEEADSVDRPHLALPMAEREVHLQAAHLQQRVAVRTGHATPSAAEAAPAPPQRRQRTPRRAPTTAGSGITRSQRPGMN